jgi:ferredoxin
VRACVDATRCRRYGICVSIAPDVFDVDDSGLAFAQTEEVPVEHEDAVQRAARSCPEGAISIEE